MSYSVLLDTSFMIRLLDKTEKLHPNAKAYYRYFLENECSMKFSTISIAEYCVRGERTDLPFKNIEVIPFNINHAEQTGIYADILFKDKGVKDDDLLPRPIIPNDSKLFSQAHLDEEIEYYVTADTRSEKTVAVLKSTTEVHFEFLDIHTPYNEYFGRLPL